MQVSALRGGLRFYRSRAGGVAEGKLIESGLHDRDGSDVVRSGNSPRRAGRRRPAPDVFFSKDRHDANTGGAGEMHGA